MSEGFQASATEQGRQFALQCETLLGSKGFALHGRRRLHEVGVEIDCVAWSRTGNEYWFEFKGSVQGARPGLLRTDTLKKAIANGALLAALPRHPPYIVLASHLPSSGAGNAMLETALRLGIFADVICLYEPTAIRRLSDL